MSAKRTNIIKFSKRLDVNVGFIILAVVCLYILVSIIIYLNSQKTVIYEVKAGSLALDNVYNAFIVRDEELVASEYSGTLNYFVNSGDKTNRSSVVYSVDEAGRVSEAIAALCDTELTDSDLYDVADQLSKYTLHFDRSDFGAVYDLHDNVEEALNSLHSNLVLSDINTIVSDTGSENLFHTVNTKEPGIVMTSYDAYTNFTENMLTPELFNNSDYSKTVLSSNELINSGDTAYRLIGSDSFTLYILLNESEAAALAGDQSASIRFIDEDIVCNATFSVVSVNGTSYGKMSLNKFMINFAEDRYVKIELMQNRTKGLKIPSTAVFSMNFYTVPKEYLTESGLFIHLYFTENGEQKYETIEATIYDEDDDCYYVSTKDFESGDILVKEGESDDQFLVGTIGERTGVYCVNRGYAVFKKVNILDRNDEYAIVESGTTYGLSVYDHIVLDYRSVDENDLVK